MPSICFLCACVRQMMKKWSATNRCWICRQSSKMGNRHRYAPALSGRDAVECWTSGAICLPAPKTSLDLVEASPKRHVLRLVVPTKRPMSRWFARIEWTNTVDLSQTNLIDRWTWRWTVATEHSWNVRQRTCIRLDTRTSTRREDTNTFRMSIASTSFASQSNPFHFLFCLARDAHCCSLPLSRFRFALKFWPPVLPRKSNLM